MLRHRLFFTIVIIGVFGIIGCLGSGIARMVDSVTETYNRDNLIRLHVVAESNLLEDQILKLKVRDKIIEVTEPLLLQVENPVEAERIIRENLPLLQKTAVEVMRQNGKQIAVKVGLERFFFPEVAYPFGILPAGEYKGVKVILGRGEGKNWWCVLYPPLCLLEPDAPSFRGATSGTPHVEYRLALLEELVKRKKLSFNDFWKEWGRFFGLLQ